MTAAPNTLSPRALSALRRVVATLLCVGVAGTLVVHGGGAGLPVFAGGNGSTNMAVGGEQATAAAKGKDAGKASKATKGSKGSKGSNGSAASVTLLGPNGDDGGGHADDPVLPGDPADPGAPGTTNPPGTNPPATRPPTTRGTQPPPPPTTKRPPANGTDIAPANGALLGAWVKPTSGKTVAEQKASYADFEAQSGRQMDIVHSFYNLGMQVPSWREPWIISQGKIPLVSWDSWPMGEINSGAHDAELGKVLNDLQALGAPVMLRWMWEMDAGWRRGDVPTPASYIAAWNRLRAIQQRQGDNRVLLVWCPTAGNFKNGSAQKYYPGDDKVDWICADGYNWAPTQEGSPWRDFAPIFQPFYDWAKTHPKPIIIGETGVLERNLNEKANWINGIVPALKSMPKIKAMVYFDSDRMEQDKNVYHWRISSSSSAVAAFKRMAADPYFV